MAELVADIRDDVTPRGRASRDRLIRALRAAVPSITAADRELIDIIERDTRRGEPDGADRPLRRIVGLIHGGPADVAEAHDEYAADPSQAG